jgi:hypothetical protein
MRLLVPGSAATARSALRFSSGRGLVRQQTKARRHRGHRLTDLPGKNGAVPSTTQARALGNVP